MIQRMLKIFGSKQRGFTLIDLTIAIAITGLISLGTSMAIVHVMKGTTYNRNHMTAIEQVQNVGHWISNDARMAQSVEPGDTLGFPLTLTWTEYGTGGNEHEIVYAITGNGLERRAYLNRDTNPDPAAITVVAQNVDLSETSCELDTNTLTVSITAKAGTGSQEDSATKKYEVVCKPLIPQE